MAKRRAVAVRSSLGEAVAWKRRHDALLDVLNAILLAYGQGDERRLPVSNAYHGMPRRPIITEPLRGDAFIVYLGPSPQEDRDGANVDQAG